MVIAITTNLKWLSGVIIKKFVATYNYMLSLVDNNISMFVERLKEDTLVTGADPEFGKRGGTFLKNS